MTDEFHSFEGHLLQEQQDTLSPELCALLKTSFPISTGYRKKNSLEDQRRGLDVAIVMRYGPAITIDLKYRREEIQLTDILLEFRHRWHDGHDSVGWVADSSKQNDLIGYVFKRDWSCWFMPRAVLHAAWNQNAEKWLEAYGQKSSPNAEYDSINCPVPIAVIEDEVRGVFIGNQTTVRSIPNPDNNFSGWCSCGAPGLFVMFEGFVPTGRQIWFCHDHRPDFRALRYEHLQKQARSPTPVPSLQPIPRTKGAPDLGKFVAQYGSWNMIPSEAWEVWDRETTAFYASLRAGEITITAEQNK